MRVPCPNNCGMLITWHATHCCHSCQYQPGRHGPQCERLEAPPNPYGPRPAEEPPFSSLFGPPPLAFQPMPAPSYPVLLEAPNPAPTPDDANTSHATGSGYLSGATLPQLGPHNMVRGGRGVSWPNTAGHTFPSIHHWPLPDGKLYVMRTDGEEIGDRYFFGLSHLFGFLCPETCRSHVCDCLIFRLHICTA